MSAEQENARAEVQAVIDKVEKVEAAIAELRVARDELHSQAMLLLINVDNDYSRSAERTAANVFSSDVQDAVRLNTIRVAMSDLLRLI
jgi:hypothetical protein